MGDRVNALQAVLLQAEIQERFLQDGLRKIVRHLEEQEKQWDLMLSYADDCCDKLQNLNNSAFHPEQRKNHIEMLSQINGMLSQQESMVKNLQVEQAEAKRQCYQMEQYCQKLRENIYKQQKKQQLHRDGKQQASSLQGMVTMKAYLN